MNWQRTVTLGVVGGALAAWFASASTSPNRGPITVRTPKTTAIDVSGAELAAEIGHLHDRLHPTVVPDQPARNLFEFNAARAARAARGVAPADVISASAAQSGPGKTAESEAPALTLIGVAQDAGSDAPRTAIISGSGQLFLVKAGDAVTGRYTVARIAGDSVDLADANTGATIHLALK